MTKNDFYKKLSELKPPIIMNDLKELYIEQDLEMFMKKSNKVWELYYSERGKRYLLSIFYSEEDALEYFLCCYKQGADSKRWF